MKEFNFQLTISSITIGSIENASSLNIGRNFLRDFKSMSKSNAGIGTVSGNNNSFPSSTNYVQDPDGVDMCWDTQGDPRENLATRKTPFPLFK
jgi:hypothetical protein